MQKLHIDFETRSLVDLKDVGTDVYTHDPSTEALMMGYAFDEEPVEIWEPHLGPIPPRVLAAMTDPEVLKLAWNVYFEFSIFNYVLGIETPMEQWFDPIAHARYLGFPGELEECGKALGIESQKIVGVATAPGATRSGTLLKNKFTKQTKAKKATKKNPAGVPAFFHDWNTAPQEWAQFKEYCMQDVRAEKEIARVLETRSPFANSEYRVWRLDQKINQRGIPIDPDFPAKALALVELERERILNEMRVVTGCENPNSPQQLKTWLAAQGFVSESLDKEHVEGALKAFDLTPPVRKLMELKQSLGGIAFKKLPVIINRTREGRIRDALTYHSAHTGRWASRGVQFHNLLRPTKRVKKNYEAIVESILTGLPMPADIPVIEAVSGSLRAAVKAKDGSRLMIADYSAIENRGLGWLAECQSILDVFEKKLDPYKSFGVKLYNKGYEEITDEERQMSKVPVLGCGYGMGGGRLVGYAANMGIELEEEYADYLVKVWRETYPEVVQYWRMLQNASIRAVTKRMYFQVGALRFDGRDPNMFKILLPNGRALHYDKPSIVKDLYNRDVLEYYGWEAKQGGWVPLQARGSSLVENVTQALCRDILVTGLFRMEKLGFPVVLHVHDEVVAEVPYSSPLTYADFKHCMIEPISWAEGFPLDVEGFEALHYKKG